MEPLVVSRLPEGGFRLLDGHARMVALQEARVAEARCLIAFDDEAFTYNKRISHLATIQEHYMIMRALAKRRLRGADCGVAEPGCRSDTQTSHHAGRHMSRGCRTPQVQEC